MGDFRRARRRVRWRVGVALAVVSATFTGGGGPAPSVAAAAPATTTTAAAVPDLPQPDAHGIRLVGAPTPVGPAAGPGESQLVDYTVQSDEVFEPRPPLSQDVDVPLTVRVWLPPGYRSDDPEPYPVLYLQHGGGGGHWQWTEPPRGVQAGFDARPVLDHAIDPDPTDATPGEALRAIVVMPDGGHAGWFTNWVGPTLGGFAPDWEDFHVRQLVPWVDANFNTVADRSGRTVAGVSMGGIGALMYGTRHPEVYSAVGSFSGVPDLSQAWAHRVISDAGWIYPGGGAAVNDTHGFDPRYLLVWPWDVEGRFSAIFGPPGPNRDWPHRNPAARVPTYAAFDGRLGIYSGQSTPTFEGSETDFGLANQAFHRALDGAGIEHRYCSGPGEHDAPYFRNDLADFLNYIYGDPWAQCTLNDGWEQDWEPPAH